MINILFVGIGGFVGASTRYLFGKYINLLFPAVSFPLATFGINILGCFLIGLLGGVSEGADIFSERMRNLIFAGMLGGFTTYSTFSYETLILLKDGQMILALLNILLHVITGLIAVWLGMQAAKYII
ncbi:MAG: fluoride efflux transporter CrcB [Bacteroidota bacterium]